MVHCDPCCYNGLSDTDNPSHWAYSETGPPAADPKVGSNIFVGTKGDINFDIENYPPEPKAGPYHSWPRLDFIPVPGPEFHPRIDFPPFLSEYQAAKKRAYDLLLAEVEFQKFIADR